MQYFIQNDAQRPHIHRIGVIMKLGLFWRDILLCSRYGLHDDLLGAEPEVCQFNQRERFASDIFGLEQYVLWLEIAMRYPMIMQFLNPLTDLQNTLQTLLLIHLVILA